ncbi:hypothetical protein [Shimia sp.]|uniref:hypothetical protein n=1 Tax=Shimia sp. TaxID=1954381 RepID=UPI003BAD6277
MRDDTEAQEFDWPREIWAAAIDHSEHEMSGTYVTSEFATVPRWEGDPERDRPMKEYVDKDIADWWEKYHRERLAAKTEVIARLESEIATLKAALAPFAKMVKDNGYDGTDHRKLAVTGRTSNRTHKNAYLALQGRYPLIGATTALRKE